MRPTSSSVGGLTTNVVNEFDVSVAKEIDNSTLWEGLFLELTHKLLNNKIFVGNIYKLPRDNNNPININVFLWLNLNQLYKS